jgi:hypothetical protein
MRIALLSTVLVSTVLVSTVLVSTVLVSTVVAAIGSISMAAAGCACPFCDAPSLMLSEQIGQCDHMLRGKWLAGEKPVSLRGGSSKFEILDVAFSKGERFQKGQIVVMPQYIAGSDTSTYTLMGPDDRLEDWHVPSEVTEASWTYLSKMPPGVKDAKAQTERLLYFWTTLSILICWFPTMRLPNLRPLRTK